MHHIFKVVPYDVLAEDENFASYIRAVNDRLVIFINHDEILYPVKLRTCTHVYCTYGHVHVPALQPWC